MTGLIRIGTAQTAARAYYGRWIADCPWCSGAVPLEPDTGGFDCPPPGCGARVEVIWPTSDMRHGVERLLSMRPNPANRNWFPGETLHDLLLENGAHGVFSRYGDMLDANGTPLLTIMGDRIELDLLPELTTTTPRPEVTT